jgi:hypothetical protein
MKMITPRDYSDCGFEQVRFENLQSGDVFQLVMARPGNGRGCFMKCYMAVDGKVVPQCMFLPAMMVMDAPKPDCEVIVVGRLAIADLNCGYESL